MPKKNIETTLAISRAPSVGPMSGNTRGAERYICQLTASRLRSIVKLLECSYSGSWCCYLPSRLVFGGLLERLDAKGSQPQGVCIPPRVSPLRDGTSDIQFVFGPQSASAHQAVASGNAAKPACLFQTNKTNIDLKGALHATPSCVVLV